MVCVLLLFCFVLFELCAGISEFCKCTGGVGYLVQVQGLIRSAGTSPSRQGGVVQFEYCAVETL